MKKQLIFILPLVALCSSALYTAEDKWEIERRVKKEVKEKWCKKNIKFLEKAQMLIRESDTTRALINYEKEGFHISEKDGKERKRLKEAYNNAVAVLKKKQRKIKRECVPFPWNKKTYKNVCYDLRQVGKLEIKGQKSNDRRPLDDPYYDDPYNRVLAPIRNMKGFPQ